MVQVPYRNFYQIETVGDTPSLRLEVNVANQSKIFPLDETPTPREGYTFIRSRVGGAKGAYDERSKMFVNFFDDVLPTGRGGAFVSDVRSFCNIIIGNPQNEPAPTDRGHFHQESGEFWLIMSGKIRYRLEDATKFGAPEVFEADPGDVVYAPRQTWHLASVGGVGTNQRGTRIAMNGYPDLAHNYEAPSEDAPARGGGPGRGGRGGRGAGQGQ
jgi:mannose-6-phosphate isomerase-like protein (cupin superfamily)